MGLRGLGVEGLRLRVFLVQSFGASGFRGLRFRVEGLGFSRRRIWSSGVRLAFRVLGLVVNTRKLERGFRRISARIPYTLPYGHEDKDVPTFWLGM